METDDRNPCAYGGFAPFAFGTGFMAAARHVQLTKDLR